jgi:predicted GTPase
MANDIRAIFASVKKEAKEFSIALQACCDRIYCELPQNYEADADSDQQLISLSVTLTQAIESLCYRLENPTLILATTGTTSSGKSTLVNLLCGAKIMPVAVQEMSAGVVTIEYSDQKAIKIDETKGATWECGTWHGVSNEDIYSRLDGIMSAYLQSRANGESSVACPQSTIFYPFRLVSEAGLLDLPEGTMVKIMDLPGLAHVGDEGNAEVIRKSKEALCLVTYNSAETDKERVAALLQEIVEQVKELGGSPARMLFILNRIDVFRSDNNWPESEELFFNRTGQEIRRKLKESLGEYDNEIDEVEVIKLSSLPALLSLEMVNGNDAEKIKASDQLDKFFNFLMPESILDDLPRKAINWTDHDRKRLYDGIWPETNAEVFQKRLKQHIQDEYPQLIIPQILQDFKDNAASKLITWASQTVSSIINSSEENYLFECKRIQDVKVNLGENIQKKAQALRDPFDEIEEVLQGTLLPREENSSDVKEPLRELEKIIVGLKKNDCFGERISKRLIPLYDWKRELASAIEKIVSSILDALEDNKSILGDKAFEYAKLGNVSLLEGIIQDLIEMSYAEYAGTKFEARTPENKEKLKKLNRKLNELSNVLKLIVDDVAKKVLKREMGRVKDAIESLFVFHLESLKKSTTDIAPGLGINFPQTGLVKVEFSVDPNFSFEGGFSVSQESYEEEVKEKAGKKRVWWTAWIWNKDVYETKMEERTSDNASIPSFDKLNRDWKIQKDRGEIEVLRQISDWWLEQLDQFNSGIEGFQSDVINRYQERLDRAYKDTTVDYESKMETWQPLKEEVASVSEKINQMGLAWREL